MITNPAFIEYLVEDCNVFDVDGLAELPASEWLPEYLDWLHWQVQTLEDLPWLTDDEQWTLAELWLEQDKWEVAVAAD